MDVPAATDAANPSRKGKDELNLATIPLSVLTHQQPTDTERNQKHYSRSFAYTVYDDQIDKWLPAKVTLKSNPTDGLPTAADESLFLALFNLAIESDHLGQERFAFVPNQLFKLMGRSPNRASYNLLRQQLARLASTKVICEYSWFDVPQEQYLTEYVFGMIADYKLHRPRQAKHSKAPKRSENFVVFDPEIYRQLTTGTLKPLDLAFYFSLKLPTSRRMYRSLDRFFYRRTKHSADLRNFAHGNLGMSNEDNVGKIKSRLGPAIDELVLRNFIQPADKSERYTKIKKGIWRVNFEKTPANKAKTKPQTKPYPLTIQLINCGITKAVAATLVSKHSADDILRHIEVFNWFNSKANNSEHKKPGWLRKAIEDDYTTPEAFTTKAQRDAITKAKRQHQAKEVAEHAALDTQRKSRTAFVALMTPHWDELPEDQQRKIVITTSSSKFEQAQLLRRLNKPSLNALEELAKQLGIETQLAE